MHPKEVGQGYPAVGWISAGSSATFHDPADRDRAQLQQAMKGIRPATIPNQAQAKTSLASQAPPPLTLTRPGQVKTPAAMQQAMADGLLYAVN